jgi:hypothetical protein
MDVAPQMLTALRIVLSLVGLLSATVAVTGAERRVALVIGVGAYQTVPPLKNTANDARAIAAALQRLGFEVDTVLDPTRTALETAVRHIGAQAKGADAAFVFYAGHALELDGRNWLLPVTADPSSIRDLRFEALDLDSLMDELNGMAHITIVMLDSCRDNPFRQRLSQDNSRSIAQTQGLAPPSSSVGTLIAFATAPGTVAQDGQGEHSPFTTGLLSHMETPGLEIRALMNLVRRDVRLATSGQQIPWENSALEGDFFLKPADAAPGATRGLGGPDADLAFWQGVRDTTNAADLQAYLQRFPHGLFTELARIRLAKLAALPADPKPSPLVDRLVASMSKTGNLKEAPYQASWFAIDARGYEAGTGQKAIAIEPDSGRSFRWSQATTAAIAEQLALEGCQQAYGKPCVPLAVGDDIKAPDPRQAARIAMPRLAYAGPFRMDMVPLIRPHAPAKAALAYSKLPNPKALAVRPSNGRFASGTGATSAAAQAAALESCNATNSLYPCFLYAIDGQVVLPHRWTEVAPQP